VRHKQDKYKVLSDAAELLSYNSEQKVLNSSSPAETTVETSRYNDLCSPL